MKGRLFVTRRREPKIPLLPKELPRQRVHAVVTLPERPATFLVSDRKPGGPGAPTKMPRSAKYVAQVEWAWSPDHTRLDAFYLSTNRSRSDWCLWLKPYDDNWGRWGEPFVIASGPMRSVTAHDAAVFLLTDAWSEAVRSEELDRFSWINEAGLLSVEELMEIARTVWPAEVLEDEED